MNNKKKIQMLAELKDLVEYDQYEVIKRLYNSNLLEEKFFQKMWNFLKFNGWKTNDEVEKEKLLDDINKKKENGEITSDEADKLKNAIDQNGSNDKSSHKNVFKKVLADNISICGIYKNMGKITIIKCKNEFMLNIFGNDKNKCNEFLKWFYENHPKERLFILPPKTIYSNRISDLKINSKTQNMIDKAGKESWKKNDSNSNNTSSNANSSSTSRVVSSTIKQQKRDQQYAPEKLSPNTSTRTVGKGRLGKAARAVNVSGGMDYDSNGYDIISEARLNTHDLNANDVIGKIIGNFRIVYDRAYCMYTSTNKKFSNIYDCKDKSTLNSLTQKLDSVISQGIEQGKKVYINSIILLSTNKDILNKLKEMIPNINSETLITEKFYNKIKSWGGFKEVRLEGSSAFNESLIINLLIDEWVLPIQLNNDQLFIVNESICLENLNIFKKIKNKF